MTLEVNMDMITDYKMKISWQYQWRWSLLIGCMLIAFNFM